jgi:hypothetical protein
VKPPESASTRSELLARATVARFEKCYRNSRAETIASLAQKVVDCVLARYSVQASRRVQTAALALLNGWVSQRDGQPNRCQEPIPVVGN